MLFSRLFHLFSGEKLGYSQALERWEQAYDECAVEHEHRNLPQPREEIRAKLRFAVIRLIQRVGSDSKSTAKHRNEQADCYVYVVVFDR